VDVRVFFLIENHRDNSSRESCRYFPIYNNGCYIITLRVTFLEDHDK